MVRFIKGVLVWAKGSTQVLTGIFSSGRRQSIKGRTANRKNLLGITENRFFHFSNVHSFIGSLLEKLANSIQIGSESIENLYVCTLKSSGFYSFPSVWLKKYWLSVHLQTAGNKHLKTVVQNLANLISLSL